MPLAAGAASRSPIPNGLRVGGGGAAGARRAMMAATAPATSATATAAAAMRISADAGRLVCGALELLPDMDLDERALLLDQDDEMDRGRTRRRWCPLAP